jgi:hypothetical protein
MTMVINWRQSGRRPLALDPPETQSAGLIEPGHSTLFADVRPDSRIASIQAGGLFKNF